MNRPTTAWAVPGALTSKIHLTPSRAAGPLPPDHRQVRRPEPAVVDDLNPGA